MGCRSLDEYFSDMTVDVCNSVCTIYIIFFLLQSFTQLKDVAVSCVRRSLTFPLVRNWHLSQQVLKDTVHLLLLGLFFVSFLSACKSIIQQSTLSVFTANIGPFCCSALKVESH